MSILLTLLSQKYAYQHQVFYYTPKRYSSCARVTVFMERGNFWKKLFKFRKSNEDSTFHFHQLNFDAVVTALAKWLRKGTFDQIFNHFFCFLLNLNFQWKPRSFSCVSKTQDFKGEKTIQNVNFRTAPENKKLSSKKHLKLFVLLHNNLSNSSKISQSLTNFKNKRRFFGKIHCTCKECR